MKKYLTLSVATLISFSAAHAETLQHALEKSRTLPQKSERVVSVKGIPATLTTAKKCVKTEVDPSKELVSSVNVSRADDTENTGETEETDSWNVSYAYPLGSFFPVISYDQTIIRKSDNVVLGVDHGLEQVGILVPPLVENTWTNLIQKTTFTATGITTQWLPDTEICDWVYYNGDYTQGGITKQNMAQSYDLNYVAQPNFVLRSNHAPYIFFRDDAYAMNDGKYVTEIVSTATYTDEQLANMAGEFDATLIADNTPVTVKADNYKNAGSYLFDYNNTTTLSAYYYTLLGNEDGAGIFKPTSLTENCKTIWSSNLGGITDFSIAGQFQLIQASPKDYIMKGISVEAMYYGPKESPIEYTIYQLDAQGNIITQLREGILDATEEMAYDADLKSYGGQVILSASFIDVFTGEEDYLTVPAGTPLMIALTGASENCVAFSPYMATYDASNGPDTYTLDNNAGVLVNYQDQLIPLPVSFYLKNQDGSYSMITNFTIAVDVEYPYLAAYGRQVPDIYDVNVGGQPTTIYDFMTEYLQDAKTEVDVVLMDVKETEFLSPTEISGKVFEYTGADYNLITNAEAKDVEITYSDDDVKNAVSCTVANGNSVNVRYSDNTTGTVDPAYVFVKMRKNEGATVPTTGWIKASYKGQEVTFNFTETSAIEGIESDIADGEAVATEYFDLQGRKLAGEANGIVIKKMTMADGSVKAVKVVK